MLPHRTFFGESRYDSMKSNVRSEIRDDANRTAPFFLDEAERPCTQ
jgi:hypothetical protein